MQRTRLIALHGFTGCGRDFEPLIRESKSWASWTCPDLPGHGDQPPPESSPLYEQAMETLHRGLQPQSSQTVAIGYSLGGRLLLHYLVEQDTALRGLVLIGVHPGIEDEAERAERRATDRKWIELLHREGIDAFLDQWKAQPLLSSQAALPPDIRQPMLERAARQNPDSIARVLDELSPARLEPVGEKIHTVHCPVLLISGEKDPKYCAVHDQLRRTLPHAHRDILPNAGHAAHLENPSAFLSALKTFIKKLPPG